MFAPSPFYPSFSVHQPITLLIDPAHRLHTNHLTTLLLPGRLAWQNVLVNVVVRQIEQGMSGLFAHCQLRALCLEQMYWS